MELKLVTFMIWALLNLKPPLHLLIFKNILLMSNCFWLLIKEFSMYLKAFTRIVVNSVSESHFTKNTLIYWYLSKQYCSSILCKIFLKLLFNKVVALNSILYLFRFCHLQHQTVDIYLVKVVVQFLLCTLASKFTFK